jgi:hypothetical protein
MKVAVIGSRTFNNYELLKTTLEKYKISNVVSGGAKGADKLSEEYAKEFNIPTTIFLPNWEKFGKSAGFKRNHHIIQNAETVIAFWDGISKGTKSSIDIAKKFNKEVIIVCF